MMIRDSAGMRHKISSFALSTLFLLNSVFSVSVVRAATHSASTDSESSAEHGNHTADLSISDGLWRRLQRETSVVESAHARAIESDYICLGNRARVSAAAEENSASALNYSFYSNANPVQKHYGRAAAEIIAGLGFATIWYFLDSSNKDDWAHGVDYDNFRSKFITGDGYSYDFNPWLTNVNHATAGAAFYLLARSNDLNVIESFLSGVGASLLWEYGTEMREDVSINDSIMNPFGGFAIGEVMYQLGEFFQHSRSTLPNRMLGILFGGPTFVHRWWDDNQPKQPQNVDRFGFTTDVWHRFRLTSGYVAAKSDEAGNGFHSEAEAGFRLELLNNSLYDSAGEDDGFYPNGVINEMEFKGSWGEDGWQDMLFTAKTAPFAYYRQRITQDAQTGQLQGYTFIAGVGASFEYLTSKFSEFDDEEKLTVANLLGPVIDVTYHNHGFKVRGSVEAYPSFSMVRPYSVDEFTRKVVDAGIARTPLGIPGLTFTRKAGRTPYYYAIGATTGGRLEISYGDYQLEGNLRYHYFDSAEGPMAYEPKTGEIDLNYTDQRLTASLALLYKLPFENFKASFATEKHIGRSKLGPFSMDAEQTRLITQLVYEF